MTGWSGDRLVRGHAGQGTGWLVRDRDRLVRGQAGQGTGWLGDRLVRGQAG